MQIDVVGGTTTEIPVPLIPAYAITGVVKNSAGEPIIGGRVEAVSIVNGKKYTSVTNDGGVYYLEGLEQGEYRISVSGFATKIADCQFACDERVRITPATAPVGEINLIVPQPATTPAKSNTSFRYRPNLLMSNSQIFHSGSLNMFASIIHNF
ncbi:carboxypeptidase-like regulatory domain-containing protein [Chamaesiphon sp. GL140_3_metabinner_50]|uniref:carboxypeptidase-like regulatory domain-containing protein n=1 Tax=Chamaesiphon sp. GL140_3_metabinner_50 TaxID=2970812 RepID=UPI0025D91CAA|nr:carboxypeptidase-like regulatory domain-containing protein [Chamaesiphon sp. GL140_3_metabinner_50]